MGLLLIIYIAFISLGLPDAAIGSAWPAMHEVLGVPVSYAGIIAGIVAGGTIVSSLMTDRLVRKFGTGRLMCISVFTTAVALLLYSSTHSFFILCIAAIPYGLGAGAVDASLNNYVALHYKARHMSWLHSFWGVGATLGPYIMGLALANKLGYTGGFRILSILQFALVAILIMTLSKWKATPKRDAEKEKNNHYAIGNLIKIRGVKKALLAFFCYCSIEQTTGLWCATYMVMNRGVTKSMATMWASLFFLGITIGRFASGFVTFRISSKTMARLGAAIVILGIVLLILPLSDIIMYVGFILIGLGSAPIYPSLIHDTPANFGKEFSGGIIGLQMATAYVGSLVAPFVFGFASDYMGMRLFPIYLIVFAVIMLICLQMLSHLPNKERVSEAT